jgi:hypothetical protein
VIAALIDAIIVYKWLLQSTSGSADLFFHKRPNASGNPRTPIAAVVRVYGHGSPSGLVKNAAAAKMVSKDHGIRTTP